MTRQFLIVLSILILFTIGCSSVKVFVDYDETVNFSNYYNFHFLNERNEVKDNTQRSAYIIEPFFERRARREITTVLSNKGFQGATHPRHSDFLITFYATARNKVEMAPPTYRAGRAGRQVRPGRVYQYKQGTLIIDVIDKEKRELIWRGVGTGVLDKNDPTKNLLQSIEKIFEDFPPK